MDSKKFNHQTNYYKDTPNDDWYVSVGNDNNYYINTVQTYFNSSEEKANTEKVTHAFGI